MTLTVYTSNNCPHCHALKDYLDSQNVTYTEKNVSNPDYRKELMSLGHMGVPVTVSDTTNVSVLGFDKIALEEMILGVE